MADNRINSPLRLTLIYAAFGSVWILLGDGLVAWHTGQALGAWLLSSAKGLVFIVATSGLLFLLSRRLVSRHLAAEEALHDSQLRWQFALEGAGDGLWDWNAQTNRVVFSKQWKAMLGYAEHEIGDSLSEWESRVHPEDLPQVQVELKRHFDGEVPVYSSEHRLRAKDGSYKWILDRGQVIQRSPDGKPLRMIGTHADITGRKSAETRIRDSLEFARTVLHSSPLGVLVYGPDGDAVTVNPAAARMVGTDVPGLLRQNFRTLESWRRYGLLAAAEQALASGRQAVHTGPLVTSFGRTLWVEAHFVPFDYMGGRHLLLILADETEPHRTVENLHLMTTAVQAMPSGWVVTDTAGNIQWVNRGFTALTGYTEAEVIGRNPRALRSGRHDSAFYAQMWQTIKRGEVWSGEIVNRRKDGTLYHEYMTIAPVLGADGAIKQFVAMKQDITERKNLEQQLARTQRLESIGLLASGIAHDLNNMLAPIMLSIGMLKLRHPDRETLGNLDAMEAAAQRGAGVVRQVLTFARGVDGERVQVEPRHLLKEVMHLAEETFPRDITVTLDLAPDTRPVLGDATQLHQVFLNLAINARDAMPGGGTLAMRAGNRVVTEAEAAQTPGLKPGDYVALSVVDSGSGIPPEVLEHIFEPFFTTKPRGKGTGLGLSTVYGIVRSHGGAVQVTSRPGEGSDFTVLLPPAAPARTPAAPAAAAPKIDGAGRWVLLVDDEPAIRLTTSLLLQGHGFQVTEAADGLEGLDRFRADPARYSLVLVDIMMPGMNGYKLAAEVRLLAPAVPIIASSGVSTDNPNDDGVEALREAGINAMLRKPYGERALFEAMTRVLRDARSAGP